MIHVQLTAAAVARELRAEHERVVEQVASIAAERRVPAEPDAYWAWVRESEQRLAALDAAARYFESLAPSAVIVEAEQLAPQATPQTLLEKARSIGVKP